MPDFMSPGFDPNKDSLTPNQARALRYLVTKYPIHLGMLLKEHGRPIDSLTFNEAKEILKAIENLGPPRINLP